jgi:hypothetical protein
MVIIWTNTWTAVAVYEVFFAAVCALIAQAKGHTPWLGVLLGVILGLLGVLFCAVMPRAAAEQPGSASRAR